MEYKIWDTEARVQRENVKSAQIGFVSQFLEQENKIIETFVPEAILYAFGKV